MKITVLGLWHLGSVTAACCAEHFDVTGLDFDQKTIVSLRGGRAPIQEPGLDELIQKGIGRRKLLFTTDAKEACAGAEIVWVCYDTPVDENDRADDAFVIRQIKKCLPYIRAGALVLISSQLPAGTCRNLQKSARKVSFAVSPENLRLGRALEVFQKAERVIVGTENNAARQKLETLFRPFTSNLIFMSPESAEMTKHALNGFLALSVTYMNEVARVCERVGADAKEVEEGLKTDVRIGRKAYLSPGQAFAGGTLARDVVTLSRIGKEKGAQLSLIPSILKSNAAHKKWALEKCLALKKTRGAKSIGILGLTYKPFANTLRRSSSLELCRELLRAGFKIKAHDPAVKAKDLDATFKKIDFHDDASGVFEGADAVVLATPWPAFRELQWESLVKKMRRPVLLDPNSFLRDHVKKISKLSYSAVGLSS